MEAFYKHVVLIYSMGFEEGVNQANMISLLLHQENKNALPAQYLRFVFLTTKVKTLCGAFGNPILVV